jgi:hypothetical protein
MIPQIAKNWYYRSAPEAKDFATQMKRPTSCELSEFAPMVLAVRSPVLWNMSSKGVTMDKVDEVAALLSEAAEVHAMMYRITDGEDPDIASWYAKWLIELSELPDILGAEPVRSHLIYELVRLEREYEEVETDEPWEMFYAAQILDIFTVEDSEEDDEYDDEDEDEEDFDDEEEGDGEEDGDAESYDESDTVTLAYEPSR